MLEHDAMLNIILSVCLLDEDAMKIRKQLFENECYVLVVSFASTQ